MASFFQRNKAALKKLWESPTLMTWVNKLVGMSRLLILTPQVLRNFDKVEIASWLLFASITFFGQVVNSRLGLTFSRMVAFAMAGAQDLSPIRDRSKVRGTGVPDWAMVGRLYGTLSSIQLILSTVVGLVATAMAVYSLSHILRGYDRPAHIWIGVALMLSTSTWNFTQQKYSAVLQGLNQVALTNRIGAVFSVLSIAAGTTVVALGGGFLGLVIAAQLFALLGGFRAKYILRHIYEGRLRKLKRYAWDSKIIAWAWPPTWKGFIYEISTQGVLQVSGILLARTGDPGLLASYLLATRVSAVVNQMSQVPYLSNIPRLARFLAEGRTDDLRTFCVSRMRLVMLLAVGGYLAIGLLADPLLHLIGSRIHFLPLPLWLLLGLFGLYERWNILSFSTSTLGNHYVYYWRQFTAALVALVCVSFAVHQHDLAWLIVSLGLPSMLIMNLAPTRIAADILNIRPARYLVSTALPAVLAYVLVSALILLAIYQFTLR